MGFLLGGGGDGTLEMAPDKVGLGAVFLAPKRRFILRLVGV